MLFVIIVFEQLIVCHLDRGQILTINAHRIFERLGVGARIESLGTPQLLIIGVI